MSDFSKKLKAILTGSAKVIGRTAKKVANATNYKMDEMSDLSQKRGLITKIGEKAYELYQQDVELPEELVELLNELKVLEENLEEKRREHAAEKAAAAAKAAAEKAERSAQKAAEKAVVYETPAQEAAADMQETEVEAPEEDAEVSEDIHE